MALASLTTSAKGLSFGGSGFGASVFLGALSAASRPGPRDGSASRSARMDGPAMETSLGVRKSPSITPGPRRPRSDPPLLRQGHPHLHAVFLDGAFYEPGTKLAWLGLGHLKTSEVGELLERVRRIERPSETG